MFAHILAFFLVFGLCAGDFFLHNPRGSNNRLNEANSNRNMNNRLFDSQNNAKGGYCYGPALSYYEGSILNVEYTPTHGCGTDDVSCTIIFQYMCTDNSNQQQNTFDTAVRDGTSTNTPTESNIAEVDGTGQFKQGMHENLQYFQNCKTRQRNRGLWIADRNLNQNVGATATRQNNNGGTSGFECNEERDYYPYWHPNPWRDAVILTDDTTLCPFYQQESHNVKEKYYCQSDSAQAPVGKQLSANNKVDCDTQGGVWKSEPAFNIPPPTCSKTSYAVDNDSPILSTPWIIPNSTMEPCIANRNCSCVFRARYNVTSNDMGSTGRENRPDTNFLDNQFNGQSSPVFQDPDFVVSGVNLSIALDTSQFGRAFQDRSYVFKIVPRPSNVSSTAKVFNLNVRGKRGHNIQVFPAAQYDFSPKNIEVTVDDYIHFQWTGCDTNPVGSAGEGLDGTDRSNIVQITSLNQIFPASDSWLQSNSPLFKDPAVRKRFAYLDQTNCTTNPNADPNTDEKDCSVLNAASPYFDGGLVQMSQAGKYFYMSTRNNNFSNRGQKGSITVRTKTGSITKEVTGDGSTGTTGDTAGVTGSVSTTSSPTGSTVNSASRFISGILALIITITFV